MLVSTLQKDGRVLVTRKVKSEYLEILRELYSLPKSGRELSKSLNIPGRAMSGLTGSMEYYGLIMKTDAYIASSPVWCITSLGTDNLTNLTP